MMIAQCLIWHVNEVPFILANHTQDESPPVATLPLLAKSVVAPHGRAAAIPHPRRPRDLSSRSACSVRVILSVPCVPSLNAPPFALKWHDMYIERPRGAASCCEELWR